MLGWLPGASKEAMAGREVADLNSRRNGSANRDGAWNWQDTFGAWLAGSDKESILALAKKKARATYHSPKSNTLVTYLLGPYQIFFWSKDWLLFAKQIRSNHKNKY